MRVRALQTIKYGSQWKVPGTPSEEFDLPDELLEKYHGIVMVVGESVVKAPPEVKGLPDDLPYRHVFEDLGIDTLDAIREIDDLTSLKGIGKKSAETVAKFLKGL